MINLIHDFVCSSLAIFQFEKVANPGDQVIFERSFDDLVEKVTRKHLVNICTREVIGKRLFDMYVSRVRLVDTHSHIQSHH